MSEHNVSSGCVGEVTYTTQQIRLQKTRYTGGYTRVSNEDMEAIGLK